MAIFEFHQFVIFEKGPVNTAIIDLLQGDIYLVPNEDVEKFKNKAYNKLPGFIDFFKKEKLLIEIEKGYWIPRIELNETSSEKHKPITLEIKEGADLNLIKIKFSTGIITVKGILFYGEQLPGEILPGVPIIKTGENFSNCIDKCKVTGKFDKIDEIHYLYNMNYNSCWGNRIAVTKDGTVRPCIYSEVILGDLLKDNFHEIIDKHYQLRKMTKDQVETCKDCELRYVCFDCREIAFRECGNLLSPNPFCKYNPKG